MPVEWLHSLASGARWCGLVGYLQEAFLTPGFSYGGLLNFQPYSFLGSALSNWVRALSLKAQLQVWGKKAAAGMVSEGDLVV